MTFPADLPPPDPDRRDPSRDRLGWGLFSAALVFFFASGVAASLHSDYRWVAMACADVLAVACVMAAVAVLAGRRGKS